NFALDENNNWQLLIIPDSAARYSVGVQVSGLRTDGTPVKEVLPSQYFSFPAMDDPVPPADNGTSVEKPVEEPVEVPTDPVPDDNKPAEINTHAITPAAAAGGDKKWLMYISIGVANLLVFGLAFSAYRIIIGGKSKEE